jgi:hypothetical protein
MVEGKVTPRFFLDHMQAPVPEFDRGGGIRPGRQMEDHFGVVDTGPPANVATGFDVSPDGRTIIYSRVDSLEHIDSHAGRGLPLCRRGRDWSWPLAEEALREQRTFPCLRKNRRESYHLLGLPRVSLARLDGRSPTSAVQPPILLPASCSPSPLRFPGGSSGSDGPSSFLPPKPG